MSLAEYTEYTEKNTQFNPAKSVTKKSTCYGYYTHRFANLDRILPEGLGFFAFRPLTGKQKEDLPLRLCELCGLCEKFIF